MSCSPIAGPVEMQVAEEAAAEVAGAAEAVGVAAAAGVAAGVVVVVVVVVAVAESAVAEAVVVAAAGCRGMIDLAGRAPRPWGLRAARHRPGSGNQIERQDGRGCQWHLAGQQEPPG